MKDQVAGFEEKDKEVAAVCGLYCRACSLFIASTEDPVRLERIARMFSTTPEDVACFGCRSSKRAPVCRNCDFVACAAGRGVEFCSECTEYPCAELTEFQAAKPHRAELWEDLNRIRDEGWRTWLAEVEKRYACSTCGTRNSAYDLACRSCGAEPSCAYVERHGERVRRHLQK